MSAHRTKSTVTEIARSSAREREFAPPRVVTDSAQLREAVLTERQAGRTIGLVPTIGALHEGHLSLLDRARAECDVTVATVFVNPSQFGPGEDFHRYPRDLFADVAMLGRRGCHLVFAPSPEGMYPPGYSTTVDVGPLGQLLEGEHRPTHFRGVATIVLKLFQLAPADRAYFGRKDYQQTLVIERMVADLNVPIDVRVCPIVREPDGLAMSSRNAYLTDDERHRARQLVAALRRAEDAGRERRTRRGDHPSDNGAGDRPRRRRQNSVHRLRRRRHRDTGRKNHRAHDDRSRRARRQHAVD